MPSPSGTAPASFTRSPEFAFELRRVGNWLAVYGISVFLNGPLADRIGGKKALLIGVIFLFQYV